MEHRLELIIPRLEIFGNLKFSIFSYPGNIRNRVFLIFWSPGNIGNWIFLVFWYPRDIGYWIFLVFWYPRDIGYLFFLVFWSPGNIGDRVFLIAWYPGNTGGGRAEAGGRLQGLCCAALDYFWNMFPGISGYPGNIGNMIFLGFWDFYKKDARRNFTQNGPIFMPRSLI